MVWECEGGCELSGVGCEGECECEWCGEVMESVNSVLRRGRL